MTQFRYFVKDIKRQLGKNRYRILIFILSPTFWALFSYRIDRSLFLFFGKFYKYLRFCLAPFYYFLQIVTKCDIHYLADIKGGIKILHSSLGVVISSNAIIGDNVSFVGGNVIGNNKNGKIIIGINCYLGANACIIGPLELADNITIGALACVVKSCKEDNSVLIGVPARITKTYH